MALPTSGALSFANLQTEFGGSNPITMGEYAAFRVSGSGNTISMNQFYGASAILDTQTVTVGVNQYTPDRYGYSNNNTIGGGIYGSMSDGTANWRGNNAYVFLFHRNSDSRILLGVSNYNLGNSGFTSMQINGPAGNVDRTAASFSQSSYFNVSYWIWTGRTTNPFGSTVGAAKTVTFV